MTFEQFYWRLLERQDEAFAHRFVDGRVLLGGDAVRRGLHGRLLRSGLVARKMMDWMVALCMAAIFGGGITFIILLLGTWLNL